MPLNKAAVGSEAVSFANTQNEVRECLCLMKRWFWCCNTSAGVCPEGPPPPDENSRSTTHKHTFSLSPPSA